MKDHEIAWGPVRRNVGCSPVFLLSGIRSRRRDAKNELLWYMDKTWKYMREQGWNIERLRIEPEIKVPQ
jgi:hypothetical protein